jgi:hypothetical protein
MPSLYLSQLYPHVGRKNVVLKLSDSTMIRTIGKYLLRPALRDEGISADVI